MSFKPDCIIVGSGPLGALSARRLAARGLNVLILEAGCSLSTPPGSHLRNQKQYQENPDDFFHEVNNRCEYFDNKVPDSGLPGANITTALGGQGILWTNNCPRPTPYFSDWPVFNEATWESHLREAEKILSIHTDLFDKSIRQQKIMQHFQQSFRGKKRSIEKLPIAAEMLSQGDIEYTATYKILSEPKEISDRIRIECEMKVIELIKDGSTIVGVKARNKDNQVVRLSAKYFMIAAGIFGTTQLLFDSNIRPNALGKYLHYHPLWFAQLILHDKFSADHNIVDLPPRLYIPPTKTHPWHAMLLRDIFTSSIDNNIHPNQLLELQFFAPQEVQEQNRMILSESTPRFEVSLSEKDKLTVKSMYDDLISIANELGQFRDVGHPVQTPAGFTHPMGTCRMGNDPMTSVADNQCRVHGFDNLFLATVGLIPISIAINPTLTAAALAVEATDVIARASL